MLIILFGWTAAAAWLWRLCQIREEMGDYEAPVSWNSLRPSRAENVAMRGLVARRLGRNSLGSAVSDWWHARLPKGASDNFRGRMRLLQFGLSGWPAELWSLAFAAVILTLGIIGGEAMSYGMRRVLHFELGTILLGMLSALPRTKFVYHRPQMVGELMFPMTRAELIDGLFAVVARQFSVLWVALHAAALIVVVLYPFEATALPVVGTFLLFSATMAVLMFGFGAYLATWSSQLLQLVIIGLGIGAVFGLLGLWVWIAEHIGVIPIIVLPLLQLFVGLAFIRIARRKWLNLELG